MVDTIGVTLREKVELVTYKLKDVAQLWFDQWGDERPLREGHVDWEVLKMAFLDMFFPIESRERKLLKIYEPLSRGSEF